MKKKIRDYINYIDKLLESKRIDNIDEIISEHLIKIGFFEHERIVHLIVTVLFALLTLITFLYTLSYPSFALIFLVLMFFALLIPYIMHYYFLENSVQKMYDQYDFLKKKANKKEQ